MRRLLLIILMSFLAGCGGSGTPDNRGSAGQPPSSSTAAASPAGQTTIQVTPTTASLVSGTSVQLKATATLPDGTTQDVSNQVTWTASSPAVTVSNTLGSLGLVAAVSETANARVTATLNGVSSAATLTVTAPTLVAIGVTPSGATLAIGTSRPLIATGVYSNDTTVDLTARVAWTSSSPAVATVSSGGRVSALSAGQSTVTATLDGIAGSATITASTATLQRIQVTTEIAAMAQNTSQRVIATGVFSDRSTQDLSDQVVWATSSPNVTVNAGLLTTSGAAPGVTLTATLGAVSGSTLLDVTAASLRFIDVTPAGLMVNAGARQQFEAVGRFSDGTSQVMTRDVQWTSSNIDAAAINSSGQATTRNAGETTISARRSGVTGNELLYVSPARLSAIEIAPRQATIAVSTLFQCEAIGHYTDGTSRDITAEVAWRVSFNEGVITVSNAAPTQGLVAGGRPGTAALTARLAGLSDVVRFDVTPATLDSLQISPANPTVAAGFPLTMTVTGTFSDGTQRDLTAAAGWSSSQPAIASITAPGRARGVSTGVTVVTAAVGSVSTTAPLTVTPALLQSVQISPANQTLLRGQSLQYQALGNFSDGTQRDITTTVTWTSSTPAVIISNVPGSQGLAFGADAARGVVITAATGALQATATLNVQGNPHLFVSNRTGGSISAFTIGADGGLTGVPGSPFASAAEPGALAATSRFVYATSNIAGPRNISAYTIDPFNGALLPVSGAPFSTTRPGPLVVTEKNDAAYIVNTTPEALSTFAADPLTGVLTLVGAQAPSGRGATSATLDPSGRFLYTANAFSHDVSAYGVSASGLTSLGTVAASGRPQGIAADPLGRFIYAADGDANVISAYVRQADGTLRAAPGSPISAFGFPNALTVDPAGKYLFVTHAARSTVSVWQIQADGSLHDVSLLTPVGAEPSGVVVDRSGRFVYVSNSDSNNLSGFAFNPADGSLTPLAGSPFAVGGGPSAITVLP